MKSRLLFRLSPWDAKELAEASITHPPAGEIDYKRLMLLAGC